MASAIRSIRHAAVNCYLVAAGGGYVLIDTGKPENRTDLDTDLEDAGCRPGMLRLIVLTQATTTMLGTRPTCAPRTALRLPCTVTIRGASNAPTGSGT